MKIKRNIIVIDENLCNGCGQCIPSCHERALQLVETPSGKKARLVKDIYCDGLGACLGTCPTGALRIETREVEPFDEVATAFHAVKTSRPEGCQSSAGNCWEQPVEQVEVAGGSVFQNSALRQWPVQLHLIQPEAPCFHNADLCITADCVPFAYANFHKDFLRGRPIVIGCPKLDDIQKYIDKLSRLFVLSTPRSVEVVIMEVPCCSGLIGLVKNALQISGADIPIHVTVISIKGRPLVSSPAV
ncbi:4Fe-4S dicluster domain-containing protein [bacterium]|nr:4Fe-4S dicluster domain-containing protein [candidate division CSSED10-310 bacterium]